MTRAARAIAVLACAAGAVAGRAADPPGSVGGPSPADSAAGAALFAAKGCVACHTIGRGTLVGPDLAGVAERREPAWIAAMIARPDSMLRDDPFARELRATYGAAMPRLGITPGEATALVAYLRAVRLRESPAAVGGCPCPRCRHGSAPHGRAEG